MSRQLQLETAWFNFVSIAIKDEFPDHSVIFAESDGPRPDKPYLTLKVTGPARVTTTDPKVYNADADKFRFETWRRYNLSIQSYGVSHLDVLDDIILGSQNPDFKQNLTDCDIGVEIRGNIIDLSDKHSTGWERRGSLDISFLASKIKLTNIGTIESTEISGEMVKANDDKINVDKFTVSEP